MLSQTFMSLAMADAHCYKARLFIANGENKRAIEEIDELRRELGFPQFMSHVTNDKNKCEEFIRSFATKPEDNDE